MRWSLSFTGIVVVASALAWPTTSDAQMGAKKSTSTTDDRATTGYLPKTESNNPQADQLKRVEKEEKAAYQPPPTPTPSVSPSPSPSNTGRGGASPAK